MNYLIYDKEAVYITKQEIEEFCNMAGMTQAELAERMEIPQEIFSSRIEKEDFTQDECEGIASILNAQYILNLVLKSGKEKEA